MNSKIVRAVVLMCLVGGCSNHPLPEGSKNPRMSDRDIYQRIHLGMSQPQVEQGVGKPHAAVSHGLAFYGAPPDPKYDPDGSRSVPFNILVAYSNGVVISKLIYAGYDVYHEGEDPFPFGNDEGVKKPESRGPIPSE
jgi:hypothetical protein